MREETKEWLTQIRNTVCEKIIAVGEVVSDYFGEDLVDVQLKDIEAFAIEVLPRTSLSDIVNAISSGKNTVKVSVPGYSSAGSLEIDRKTYEEDCKGYFYDNLREVYHPLLAAWIKDVFITYYGSHSTSILVKFPEVKVQNENDAFVIIKDLYAQLLIKRDGRLNYYIRLNRANYPTSHYISGYSHSHLPGIHFDFTEPCFGSGPIVATQNSLHRTYDLDRYGLLCYELAKYVTVESLAGVPYRRLENIGNNSGRRTVNMNQVRYRYFGIRGGVVQNFTRYYVRTQTFPVAFTEGTYVLGMPLLDYMIALSKCFIKWYNEARRAGLYSGTLRDLMDDGILSRYIIDNKRLYFPTGSDNVPDSIDSARGRELFLFKGEPVTLTITEDTENQPDNEVILLRPDVVNAIVKRCLRAINYNYGQKDNNQTTTGKKNCYI